MGCCVRPFAGSELRDGRASSPASRVAIAARAALPGGCAIATRALSEEVIRGLHVSGVQQTAEVSAFDIPRQEVPAVSPAIYVFDGSRDHPCLKTRWELRH